MIDLKDKMFETEVDEDNGRKEFLRPLSRVIDRHMSTSKKYFRPCSLIEDFEALGVKVSRQAINSALRTLLKHGDIQRAGPALYHHKNAYD